MTLRDRRTVRQLRLATPCFARSATPRNEKECLAAARVTLTVHRKQSRKANNLHINELSAIIPINSLRNALGFGRQRLQVEEVPVPPAGFNLNSESGNLESGERQSCTYAQTNQ